MAQPPKKFTVTKSFVTAKSFTPVQKAILAKTQKQTDTLVKAKPPEMIAVALQKTHPQLVAQVMDVRRVPEDVTPVEKLKAPYAGLAIRATEMMPPVRMIDMGLHPTDRWWDGETEIKKSQSHRFSVTVPSTEGFSVDVIRGWSEKDQRKIFFIRLPDGSVVPQNDYDVSTLHPFFLDHALEKDGTILLTEGYRAAEALRKMGHVAIGTLDAGTLPVPEILQQLKGRDILFWPDNDDVGVSFMLRMRKALLAAGAHDAGLVRYVNGPLHGDAADVLHKQVVARLIKNAHPWPAELLAQQAKPARIARVGTSLRLRPNSIIAGGAK